MIKKQDDVIKKELKKIFQLTWRIAIHEDVADAGIMLWKYPSSSDLLHHHLGFCELVLVLSGTAVNETDKGRISISEGDVFIMRPGSIHHYLAMNQFKHYVILLKTKLLEMISGLLEPLPNFHELFQSTSDGTPVFHIEERFLPEVISKIEAAQAEYMNRTTGWKNAFYAEIVRVLVAILRHTHRSKMQSNPTIYQIENVIRIMKKNLQAKYTLQSLSSIARMSVSNFRLQFREITGISPIDYLIRLRLKQAAMFMAHSDLRISEIMMQTGFVDSSYFSRQFRAVFGYTPRGFRKAIQNNSLIFSEKIAEVLPTNINLPDIKSNCR